MTRAHSRQIENVYPSFCGNPRQPISGPGPPNVRALNGLAGLIAVVELLHHGSHQGACHLEGMQCGASPTAPSPTAAGWQDPSDALQQPANRLTPVPYGTMKLVEQLLR